MKDLKKKEKKKRKAFCTLIVCYVILSSNGNCNQKNIIFLSL